MPRRVVVYIAFLVLIAATATGQGPIFHPDDFVDPPTHTRPLYVLRAITGAVLNPADHYRKREEGTGFLLITNSLYAGPIQLDYKHTEFIGGDDPPPLQRCDCPEPVYFPTPPPSNAAPEAPLAKRSDTVQFAFYRTSGSSQQPITLRYRLTATTQKIDIVVTAPATGQVIEQLSGHDRSISFDADTHFRIGRHNIWGSLYVGRTWSKGTPDDRAQNEVLYVARPPGFTAGAFLFQTRVKAGVITDRGATTLNVINPTLETVWRHEKSSVTFHFVWSLEGTRDDLEGWQANNQIGIYADWVYAALLKR
jgi:hypothetical protein